MTTGATAFGVQTPPAHDSHDVRRLRQMAGRERHTHSSILYDLSPSQESRTTRSHKIAELQIFLFFATANFANIRSLRATSCFVVVPVSTRRRFFLYQLPLRRLGLLERHGRSRPVRPVRHQVEPELCLSLPFFARMCLQTTDSTESVSSNCLNSRTWTSPPRSPARWRRRKILVVPLVPESAEDLLEQVSKSVVQEH